TGVFTVVPPRVAVHDLDLTTRALNLHGLHARSLGSSLFAHVTGFVELDTLTAPRASVVTTLGASWLGGAPLDSARATLVARDSLLGTDSLHVWGPGGLDVDVRGRLRLAGASPDDSLLIRANTDSLSLVAPLLVALVPSLGDLPDSVGGAVSVVASTHGNPAALVVRGTAGASSFRWGVATARGVRVLGQWSDDQTVPMSLRAEARAILLGRFTFLRPLVTIDGAPDSIIWRARSALGPDASWAGAGQLVPRDHGLDIPMDSLVLTLPDQAWRLDSLARFGVRDSTVLLSHVAFHATTGPGSLSVSGIHPRLGSGDIAVNLTAVPLPDIWALIQRDPAEVGGLVSGAVGLKGELHTPAMSATITVQDGKFGEFVAPRVTASLDYHDHRLGGQLDLYKDALRTMDVGIDLPLDLALVSVAQRQLPGALTVRAHTDSLDLAFLEAFSPNVRATSGTLRADVSINGSWDAPVLRGAVAVTDGGVSLPALGARYDDIYARLTLSGDTIRVDSLSASGEKGTASARGTVRLVQLTQPVLRLDIDANDFRALNIRNFLELAGTGQLHLEGPAIGATLTGRATVTRGVLYFADLITKNVVNLDALDEALGDSTLKAAVERQGLGPEFQSRFLDSLRIDTMAVEMGSEVWLRSSEANIALTGQVTVGKTANRYRVDGILETPRGTYRLPIPLGVQTINRDFTVTRGRVQYFGTADLNAVLDVDAQHVVRTTKGESVTTFVNIGGTLYVPKLTLSSDVRPAISETEIMSYLLFGAPSLASMQGSPLQHAVSEYVGVLSGQLESTLISDLRVPLDYLSIRTGDAGVGGTEIAAGRQVGAFFLTVSQRVCPGQTAISNLGGSLEYRFSREWRMAFSRDAVHGCDFLVGQGAPVSYQVGLDLIWEMSH
ncbi:MAG TPA: translocation/assembly module TamB domain-containing protein, partial [Gemmatimonadales bacterium]